MHHLAIRSGYTWALLAADGQGRFRMFRGGCWQVCPRNAAKTQYSRER